MSRFIAIALALASLSDVARAAGDEYGKHDLALIAAMAKSKLTLAEGIGLAAKSGVPLSARFDLDDAGRLSLVVVIAAQPVNTEVENNEFRRLAGNPSKAWQPRASAVRDLPLVARAAQQAVLLAISPLSLADMARKAEAKGAPFTIAPDIRNRRPVFVVIVAAGERVSELAFDALTGEPAKD
jgi:hypothetical protein